MAKEKAVYAVVSDFGQLLDKLIDLNYERFGHIDSKIIRAVAITNKENKSGKPFSIKKVNNPVAMFCAFRYIVVVYADQWEIMTNDQKALIGLDILFSLDPDEDEPKLIPPDVSDHADMLRTFGVDYLNDPTITGLLEKRVEWKAGIPEDEQ